MYPNSALAAWQLAIIAVVAVAGVAIWLAAVYLAAREPRDHAQAPAETGTTPAISSSAANEREPGRHAA